MRFLKAASSVIFFLRPSATTSLLSMMRSSSAGKTAWIGMLRYCGGSARWAISSSDSRICWPLTTATTGSLGAVLAWGGLAGCCAVGVACAGWGGVCGLAAGGDAAGGGGGGWLGPRANPQAGPPPHTTMTRKRRKQRLMTGSEDEISTSGVAWSVYTGAVAPSKRRQHARPGNARRLRHFFVSRALAILVNRPARVDTVPAALYLSLGRRATCPPKSLKYRGFHAGGARPRPVRHVQRPHR